MIDIVDALDLLDSCIREDGDDYRLPRRHDLWTDDRAPRPAHGAAARGRVLTAARRRIDPDRATFIRTAAYPA